MFMVHIPFNGYNPSLFKETQKLKEKPGLWPGQICLTGRGISPWPSLICLTKYELSKIPDLKDLNFLHPWAPQKTVSPESNKDMVSSWYL